MLVPTHFQAQVWEQAEAIAGIQEMLEIEKEGNGKQRVNDPSPPTARGRNMTLRRLTGVSWLPVGPNA